MCRYDTKLFDAEVTETRSARRWLVETLERWELGAVADEIELAGSELVTNALLHTRSGFAVMLAACDGLVELAVRDRDPRAPVMRPARLDLLSDVESLAEAGVSGDESDHHDPARHPSLHVGPSGSIAAGRGLIIVDAIADEWGVASHSEGKDVWLRVPVPASWPYAHDCDCGGARFEYFATASGHPVRHQQGRWDPTAPDETRTGEPA